MQSKRLQQNILQQAYTLRHVNALTIAQVILFTFIRLSKPVIIKRLYFKDSQPLTQLNSEWRSFAVDA